MKEANDNPERSQKIVELTISLDDMEQIYFSANDVHNEVIKLPLTDEQYIPIRNAILELKSKINQWVSHGIALKLGNAHPIINYNP